MKILERIIKKEKLRKDNLKKNLKDVLKIKYKIKI